MTLFNTSSVYKSGENLGAAERPRTPDGPGGIAVNETPWRDSKAVALYGALKKIARAERVEGKSTPVYSFGPVDAGDDWTQDVRFHSDELFGAYYCLLAVMTPGTKLYQAFGAAANQSVVWELLGKLRLAGQVKKELGIEQVKEPTLAIDAEHAEAVAESA
jgi:hypothetical protein